MSGKHDRASELRAIADGRLLLNVRNGVTVPRSMLAKIADEFEAMSTALAAKDAELARRDMQLEASAKVALDLSAQLAEARKALNAGEALSRQLRAVIDRLNGQAYSSTLSALNYFDAARRSLEAQGGENG